MGFRFNVFCAVLALAVAAPVAMSSAAMAQGSSATKSALTPAEIEAALRAAGLSVEMSVDAATGNPVANANTGEVQFFVRALDCQARACSTLVFFANFGLQRPVTGDDFRVINRFNDQQVFGRAYILEAQGQVGVDYVIELDGGVLMGNVSANISRWSDVIAAFIDNFRRGVGSV